jgi:hypothetical protein
MLLEHKSAVIYGAGGAIGGAVARTRHVADAVHRGASGVSGGAVARRTATA